MKKGFISMRTNGDWGLVTPVIWKQNRWNVAIPYIYINGSWIKSNAAGTNMVYWFDSNGNTMVDSNGKTILVRQNINLHSRNNV